MHTSFHRHPLSRQRGMGATVILFTIALIVLVGAALAYGSRGNSKAFSGESAKVMSAVLLKQSAEYRDAYNRYVFDGGDPAAMAFAVTAVSPSKALFDPAKQYGVLQQPPLEAQTTASDWDYQAATAVTGVGSSAKDSIVFLLNVKLAVCQQINKQLYGDAITDAPVVTNVAGTSVAILAAATLTVTSGRATGCIASTDTTPVYIFYSTLAEN